MHVTSIRLLHISLFSMKFLEKIIPSGRQYFFNENKIYKNTHQEHRNLESTLISKVYCDVNLSRLKICTRQRYSLEQCFPSFFRRRYS
jgi:hypothetical protein